MIAADIQSLDPGAIVELFELDATNVGGSVSRFHAGTNALMQPVVWQGNTYPAMPIQAEGFAYSGKGTLPRPSLRVANVSGAISALVLAQDDLVGATLTRKRTLAKYLDAANFSGGNPSADPAQAFPDDVFYVEQKKLETAELVEFELASAMDLQGVTLPARRIVANSCQWVYRGSECGYTGTNYFEADDSSTGNAQLDVCGKRLASCKLRFGATAELPFGAFPACRRFTA